MSQTLKSFVANLDNQYSVEKHGKNCNRYHFYAENLHFCINVYKHNKKYEYDFWCSFMNICSDDIEFKSCKDLKMFINGIIQLFKGHNMPDPSWGQ